MKDFDISEAAKALAPSGLLRATINVGNPILARRAEAQDGVAGVSVDLARTLAARLGVPLELVVFDAAGKAVTAVEEGRAEIGFFARDPGRAGLIAFTAPYVLIEGCYLVRQNSPIATMADVDVAEHTLVVGKGSAYDLYLTREIRKATIERSATSPTVVQHFLDTGADVAAGVRQQLEQDAERFEGLRLLPGRFMVIEQAMGVARTHGPLAESFLTAFVEGMKSDGLVADFLKVNGVDAVSVAPLTTSVGVMGD
ncbi:transporter substrate-binding domain-containing protein [Agrobacterium pusense]|uniref:transporter substrate-binding domain-containing protein n=1 Tax=Agrobacterium pusense TaxID=648995 RepID=UPI001C6F2657|nr:transporter substrate-binding domain-containing protein [Agrobacterium pusense]MBW9061602.1 transporter substrate-binding domain-containing protein [Agrobacterium pusense]